MGCVSLLDAIIHESSSLAAAEPDGTPYNLPNLSHSESPKSISHLFTSILISSRQREPHMERTRPVLTLIRQCEHIFTRGPRKGERCPELGGGYHEKSMLLCKAHSGRKVMKCLECLTVHSGPQRQCLACAKVCTCGKPKLAMGSVCGHCALFDDLVACDVYAGGCQSSFKCRRIGRLHDVASHIEKTHCGLGIISCCEITEGELVTEPELVELFFPLRREVCACRVMEPCRPGAFPPRVPICGA